MNLALTKECHVCGSKNSLAQCSACHAVLYCSREHQIADRQEHEPTCNAVKNFQEAVDREEQALRSRPEKFFETRVGRFGRIPETLQYIIAKFSLAGELLQMNTYSAVETVVDHLMEILRLCNGDYLNPRDQIPTMLLRLGRDQECYDFIKWFHTTGRVLYSGYRTRMPFGHFLEPKNADVFESVDIYCHTYCGLHHTVSLTLLKIRLLLDIQALQNSGCISEKLPQELFNNVRGQLVNTFVVAQNKDIMHSKDQKDLIDWLQIQVRLLYKVVKNASMRFWPALIHPEPYLGGHPKVHSLAEQDLMEVALNYCYKSWAETPGAIDVIRDIVQNDTSN